MSYCANEEQLYFVTNAIIRYTFYHVFINVRNLKLL